MSVAARITVIGAGTMGHGIAYAAALVGCAVTLTDSDPAALELAWSKIDGLLAGGMKRGKLTDADAAKIRGRLRTKPDAADAAIRSFMICPDLGLAVEIRPDQSTSISTAGTTSLAHTDPRWLGRASVIFACAFECAAPWRVAHDVPA